MKRFKDLEFKDHLNNGYGFGSQARMDFENGYGISVVNGRAAYCGPSTYEVAIMYNGELTYSTEITNDVLGHQSPSDIDVLMEQIQNLQP